MRVAPYSYDWVDNGGRRSPRELLELPEPVVGEAFTAVAGRKLGRIVQVDPGRSITGKLLDAHITYLVNAAPHASTRLLFKLVMVTNPVVAQALCLGDLVMARRQLLNIKRFAEANK